MAKKIALLISLVMIFSLSFVFASEDTAAVAIPEEVTENVTISGEELSTDYTSPEIVSGEDIVDGTIDSISGEETVNDTESTPAENENQTANDTESTPTENETETEDEHNHDHDDESSNSTVLGAVIAIVIVVAVVAIVAVIQKK